MVITARLFRSEKTDSLLTRVIPQHILTGFYNYMFEGAEDYKDIADFWKEVQPLLEGSSKWSFTSLVRYAFTNLAAFTTVPLQLVTVLGVVVFLCSVVLGSWCLWQKATGQALEGFTTVILLQLLIGSVLMFCLGIIGYYIAKIYEEIKDRPRYIIAQELEGEADHGTETH